ncbi:MAG: glycosyltransferase [Verrucomicrobiota bacterium]
MRQWRIIHTESSVGWGGQEHRVFLELDWMRRHGHAVALLAPPKAEIYARAKAAGIPVEAVSFQRGRMPLEVVRLRRRFARGGADVVNTHSSRDAWTAGLAARLAGVPLVIRSRHIEVDYRASLLTRANFELLHDYVLTTSQVISQRLVREAGLDAKRVECLPTGVDLRRFDPATVEPGKLHRELDLPPSTPLVGMVSVIRSWKGHAVFLEAARRLIDAGSPAHFTMTGGEMGRRELLEKIEKLGLVGRAHYIGYREDVPEVLASLAALVLPSTAHEGVPQAVLQAHAMARPVVGSRIGGIPEVVEHGVTGLLAAPGDATGLAAQIHAVLENPAAAQRRAETARKLVREHHSDDAMGRRLLEIYQRYLPKD